MPRTQVFRQKRPYILIIARTFAFYKCFFAHAVSFWSSFFWRPSFPGLFFMLWVLHLRFADLLFQLPFPFALLFMLWVLGSRSTVLPVSWGDVCLLYLFNRMGHA